jgi:hypothetical protein
MEDTTATAAESSPNQTRNEVPALTPAGSQINSEWPMLKNARRFLKLLLDDVIGQAGAPLPDWHAVFRCGTVVRVTGADSEFKGYESKSYKFPSNNFENNYAAVDLIMNDNAKVWDAQRVLPNPAGAVIRRAYAKMLSQGCVYAGDSLYSYKLTSSGMTATNGETLYFMHWPRFDSTGGKVFNLAFLKTTKEGHGVSLRQYDYMFPEVAFLISPAAVVWEYGSDGQFAKVKTC